MAEINESINELNQSIQELNMILVNFGSNIGSVSNSSKNSANNITLASKASAAVATSYKTLENTALNVVKGFKDLSSSAASASDAMSFAGQAIGTVANAASNTAKQFGGVGKGAGFVIDALASLAQTILSFATASLDAKDAISSMGAFGKISSDEIKELAKNSQMYNGDMVKYARTVKSLGNDIISLGGSVVEGVNNFSKLSTITDQQRMGFQRLGITTDDLIGFTKDFITLQAQTSTYLSKELLQSSRLNKYQDEYIENIIVLSELAGQDIEKTKKQALEANSIRELELKYAEMGMQAQERRRNGDEKGAIAIEDQIQTMKKAMTEVASFGSSAHTAAMANYLATGAITEQNKILIQQRFPLQEFTNSIENGTYKTGFALQQLSNGVMDSVKQFGTSAKFNKEIQEGMIGPSESVRNATKYYGKNLQEIAEIQAKERDIIKQNTGKKDPLEDTRINFQNAMKALQEFLSQFMSTMQRIFLPSINTFANWLEYGGKKLTAYIPQFEAFVKKIIDTMQEFEFSIKEIVPIIIEGLGSFIPFAGDLVEKARQARLAARPKPKTVEESSFLSTYVGTSTAGAGRGSINPPMASELVGSQIMSDYMARVERVESSGDPTKTNKASSAAGLHQFTADTWTKTVKQMGKDYSLADRFDPVKSREVFQFFTDQNKKTLESKFGTPASQTDLYMTHFLGAPVGSKFLQALKTNPNVSADGVVGTEAANSNRNIFYDQGRARTVGEVYQLMSNKMAGNVQTPASPKTSMPYYGSLLPSPPGYQSTSTPANYLTTSSPTPQYASELMAKIDIIIDKLARSISIEEDILKYAKFKS